MLNNDIFALIITFGASIVWLRINDFLAHRGIISSPISRKIIHIGTGPIFVLCWLLFSGEWYSRYLAALVPLSITGQFLLIGLGLIKDQASVDAMSRTGDHREILRGPLYYGIVFVLITVVFWKSTFIGIIALMMMCGGDGLADIIGRRYPILKIPWSPKKTLGGSLTVFVGGWLFSFAIMNIFFKATNYSGHITDYLMGLTIISLIGALIETIPLPDIDNITVPAVAVIAGMLLFPL